MAIPKVDTNGDTDYASFLTPLVDDLRRMASEGFRVFDAYTKQDITVRCICPYFSGDIDQIAGYAGHDSKFPRRCCKFQGDSQDADPAPRDQSWFESDCLKFSNFFKFGKSAEGNKTLYSQEGIEYYSPIFDLYSSKPPHCLPFETTHLLFEGMCKKIFSLFYEEGPAFLSSEDRAKLKTIIGNTKGL